MHISFNIYFIISNILKQKKIIFLNNTIIHWYYINNIIAKKKIYNESLCK